MKRLFKIKYPKDWQMPKDQDTLMLNPEWLKAGTEEAEDRPWDILTLLAERYGADKWGRHFYTPHYHRILEEFRKKPITMLEIGVGGYNDESLGGHSLRMWKEYFPLATIVGLDIYDKTSLAEPRINIEVGDQTDPAVFEKLEKKYGEFDIIIDDGSHISENTFASFNGLWPLLKDGGWYIIEDLQTSYWPQFGGNSEPGTWNIIEFLKTLIDSLNYEDRDIEDYEPTDLDRSVVALEFYHNLAFIKKGKNNEGSIGFLPQHPHKKIFTPEYIQEHFGLYDFCSEDGIIKERVDNEDMD